MNSYSCCDDKSTTSQEVQSLSGLLKIVAEQSRLRLLCILRDGGEHCVCELEDHAADLSQSLISHHLADLKQAGLVVSEKRGLRMHYSLSEHGQRVTEVVFSLIDEKGCTPKQSMSCDNKCCKRKGE